MFLAESLRREIAQTVNKTRKTNAKLIAAKIPPMKNADSGGKLVASHGIAIWLVCKELKIRRDRIDAKNHDRDRERRENHRPESSHNYLTTKLNRGARRRRPSAAAPSYGYAAEYTYD